MKEWKTCFRVGVSVFALYLCITYWPSLVSLLGALTHAAMPLLLGCVLAYLVNILMNFYEKRCFSRMGVGVLGRGRRPLCMLAAFLTLVVLAILMTRMVLPELASCVRLLVSQVPGAISDLVAWLKEQNILPEDLLASLGSVDWTSRMEQIVQLLLSGVGSVMDTVISAVTSAFSGIVTALFALIFSIYLLMGKEKLGGQCERVMKRYMSRKVYTGVRHVLSVVNDCFHKYIVGQCTEAVILGILCTAGMLILRIPYATITGALIASTALIPVAGAYIGAAVGAVMILTVSPVKALVFLVYIVVLQQLEGNLIYPRVVGSSLGLPAIWVLAAVTIGGGIMGILGMFLCVPLAAVLYRLLQEDVRRPAGPKRTEAGGVTV